MRNVRTGAAVALGLALLASAASAQPGGGLPGKGKSTLAEHPDLFKGLFGGKPPEPKPGPQAPPAPSVKSVARAQDRHLNAYLRRLAVSDRLKAVALEAGDEALFQEAEQLAELALQVFQHSSTRLAGGAASLADVTEARPPAGKAAAPGRSASAREGKR